MPRENLPTTQGRKQRAHVACDFCRQRKLGCNNVKPKCENCYEHQKDCTYTVQIRKERPSNSRINILREENSRLRKDVERLRSVIGVEQTGNWEESQQVDVSGPSDLSTSQGRAFSSELQATIVSQTSDRGRNIHTATDLISAESHGAQFHGPTSAMFDGENPHRRKKAGSIAVANANVSHKTQLLAESARQRQLEPINLRSGKLNFDGLDPELGMVLLSVFWNRQHATGLVVYRPCFMRDMISQGPYFSRLLLNTIFFVASKYVASKDGPASEGPCNVIDTFSTGLPFRRKVEDILHDPETRILCKSSVTTVQALLLLSDTLFSWCDERSLSWHYLGIAINMMIDIGIHSENSSLTLAKSHSPEEMEIHRRVFWAAFVLDKVQSIYQGRPARLRDTDNSVPMMFLDEYEELEPFETLGYSATPSTLGLPTHSVSTFEHLCKLSTIADRILCSLYVEKSSQMDPEGLFRTSQALNSDLIAWYKSLPKHLSNNFDTSRRPNKSKDCVVLPHILSLILMFHALLILLHRPFVSEGHLKSVARSAARNAFTICKTAASEIDVILQWYKSQWCIKSPPYFVSYAAYVSATIHVRTAAQNPPRSKAHQRLRNCLEILSEHQNRCHAPRRSLAILLELVRRLRVDVGGVFTAFTSRTAGVEVSMLEGRREISCVSPRSSSLEIPSNNAPLRQTHASEVLGDMRSFDLTAGDPIQPSNTGSELEELASTPVDRNRHGQIDSESTSINYGLDELFPDMYFDFDPLFGFNNFQMY